MAGNRGAYAQSPARVDSDEVRLREVARELLRWIGDNSGYDTARFVANPPKISFSDPGETVVYEGRPIVLHEPVKGVYDIQVRRITLVRPWSRKDLFNISTLLHELVHYVQYESRDWTCWHATEWEAYKLQERWLRERGIDAGFNWVEIYLLSRCTPRDIHR